MIVHLNAFHESFHHKLGIRRGRFTAFPALVSVNSGLKPLRFKARVYLTSLGTAVNEMC
jgi:hypothetical protein